MTDKQACPGTNHKCIDSRVTKIGETRCQSYQFKKKCLGIENNPEEKYYFIAVGENYYREFIGIKNYVINIHPFVWLKENKNKNANYPVSLVGFHSITREEYELWQEVNK